MRTGVPQAMSIVALAVAPAATSSSLVEAAPEPQCSTSPPTVARYCPGNSREISTVVPWLIVTLVSSAGPVTCSANPSGSPYCPDTAMLTRSTPDGTQLTRNTISAVASQGTSTTAGFPPRMLQFRSTLPRLTVT